MANFDFDRDVTILLADDHEIVRSGIRRLLNVNKNIKIVDEAANGKDAVDLIKYHEPDVVLLDILMPKMNGIEVTKIIKQEMPEVYIIMLTAFEDYKHIEQALEAGANGYLSKDISAKELNESIKSVISGERVLSRSIINTLRKKVLPETEPDNTPVVITKREQEILDLVADGKSSPEIAEKLFISVRTVESHRYNLMQKLGVNNTASLVRYALSKKKYTDPNN